MFPGWISTRTGVSWSFLYYGVLKIPPWEGITGPAHLVTSLGNILLQTGRKIHIWVSFALPPCLLLGQRLPQPCPEGSGSSLPSRTCPGCPMSQFLWEITSGATWVALAASHLQLEKDSDVLGSSWFFSHWRQLDLQGWTQPFPFQILWHK